MGSRVFPLCWCGTRRLLGSALRAVVSCRGRDLGHGDSGGPSDRIRFTRPASSLAEGASGRGAVIWRVAPQSSASSAVPPPFRGVTLLPLSGSCAPSGRQWPVAGAASRLPGPLVGSRQVSGGPVPRRARTEGSSPAKEAEDPPACPPPPPPRSPAPSPGPLVQGSVLFLPRQSVHSGGPESPSSLGAAPGVRPGENLCPESGSRCGGRLLGFKLLSPPLDLNLFCCHFPVVVKRS